MLSLAISSAVRARPAKKTCKCPGCGDGALRHAYGSCVGLALGRKQDHGFCFVCLERWKCSTCGRQVGGAKPLETRPLGSSCPSCASLQLHQPAMDVEDSSSAWEPHKGRCYHSLGYLACPYTTPDACAIDAVKSFFGEHGLQYVFCSEDCDGIVKQTRDLSARKLQMPGGCPAGHMEAFQILIRAVQEDNWKEIVAYCSKKEGPRT